MADSGWGPEPVGGGVTLLESLANLGLIALTILGATVLVAAHPTRTSGATRSARLEWQQRQQQIEAAVAEEQAAGGGQHAPASQQQ